MGTKRVFHALYIPPTLPTYLPLSLPLPTYLPLSLPVPTPTDDLMKTLPTVQGRGAVGEWVEGGIGSSDCFRCTKGSPIT